MRLSDIMLAVHLGRVRFKDIVLHQENLLYLCETGIFHSVWVAVLSAGWDESLIPTSRPDSHPFSIVMPTKYVMNPNKLIS